MQIANETPFTVEALPFKGPGGKHVLTVIVKGTFDIPANGGAVAPSDEQMPVVYGDIPYDEDISSTAKFESDVVPFKPRADIVLVGCACAPGAKMVQIMDVAVCVGSLKKIVRVFGDRVWTDGRLSKPRPSAPAFYSSMDLIYENAFGGMDLQAGGWCPENLVGKGYISQANKKNVEGIVLPNMEDPKRLIQTTADHPAPAGFGFYGKTWEPRVKFMGTFDEKWRRERSPDMPADFRFDFYCGAHPDLQVEGYLKGDEYVELINVSPKGPLRFHLPGSNPACSVVKSHEFFPEEEIPLDAPSREESWNEPVDLKLDTLCFVPEQMRFYQVWRGLCPLLDFRAMEVKTVKIEGRQSSL